MRTGYLLEFTKSDDDGKIKPQGVASKIAILLTNMHAESIGNIANLLPDMQENLANENLINNKVRAKCLKEIFSPLMQLQRKIIVLLL